MSKKFTAVEYAVLKSRSKELREQGMSYRKIALQLGVAMSTVREYIAEDGLMENAPATRFQRYIAVKDLMALGKTQNEIAAELRLSPYTIEKYIRDVKRDVVVPATRQIVKSHRPIIGCDDIPVLGEINWDKYPRFQDVKLKNGR